MPNRIINKALPFFSTILFAVSACDDTITFSNTPPAGLSITRDICYLATNKSVTLTGNAADPDGDPITFSWTANAGVFDPADGTGRVVSWRSPSVPGTYRVVLTVSDGIDEATKGIDIEVGPRVVVSLGEIVLDQTELPYFIEQTSPLLIGSITTLRVGPGVTVIVSDAGGGLSIEGTMIVEGTAGERVTFRPNSCPGQQGRWQGISFAGDQARGTLSHVYMARAETAIRVENGASVDCTGLYLEHCGGDAIAVIDSGTVSIDASRIWNNAHGIKVENGIMHITGSSVRENGTYGFFLVSNSYGGPFEALITACVVAANDGDGFILSQYANPVINGNSIFFNQTQAGTGFAIRLQAYSGDRAIDATGNYWGVDNEADILEQLFIGPAAAEIDYSGWLSEPPVHF